MQPPMLFHRSRIAQRLKRRGPQPDDFFVKLIHTDMHERLGTITRTFSNALLLAPSADFLTPKSASAEAPIEFKCATTLLAHDDYPQIDTETFELQSEKPFDLIVSLMDLQTLNDVPGFLKKARQQLKPDGLFLAVAIGGESLKELRAAWLSADEEISGGAFLRVAPFIDVRDAGRLLLHAGLALPVADIESTIVRYEHPLGLMDELRKQGATNPMIELPHKATSRKLLGQVINNYLDKNQDPDGRVRATLELIWLSAWAPHESQQKPLAPGSAKMSLKDTLEKKN